jgi:hypothetical protein
MEVLNRTLAAYTRFQWIDKNRGEKVFFRVVEVHRCTMKEEGSGSADIGEFTTLSWEPNESYTNRRFAIKCNCSSRANCTFQARCRYHLEFYYSNDTMDAIYIQGPSVYRLASICQMSGDSFFEIRGVGPVQCELPRDKRNAYFM